MFVVLNWTCLKLSSLPPHLRSPGEGPAKRDERR